MDAALSLLRNLNQLENEQGQRYSDLIQYHEYRPWWFHQQFVYDNYLVPYVRRTPNPDHHPPFHQARRLASQLYFRAASAFTLAKALVRRPDVWIYTVDSVGDHGGNRWIQALHDTLTQRGQRFLEIVWSTGGANALRSARLRNHSVVYWQGVAPFASTPNNEESPRFNEDAESFLRDVALRVMLPRCQYSVSMIERFQSLLRMQKPRGVYVMDDSLHAFELVVACKRAGIPTIGIQHGQFSRFSVGLMGYGIVGRSIAFDRYCVWGEWFKQILVDNSALIPADSVVVAGSFNPGRTLPTAVARSGEQPVVLFIGEHYDDAMDRAEVQPYLQALRDGGSEVMLRPHPARANTEASDGLHEMLRRADVVVASYSSVVFEAMLHEKPIVLFKTSQFQDPHGLAAAGFASIATTPHDIVSVVREAHALSPTERTRRREGVWGLSTQNAGETAMREMNDLVSSNQAANSL